MEVAYRPRGGEEGVEVNTVEVSGVKEEREEEVPDFQEN